MSVVAIILAGAVFATADVANAPTADGRMVYVARVDCAIGHGYLHLSNKDGTDMHRGPFFVLGASDTASTAATLLCKEFQ